MDESGEKSGSTPQPSEEKLLPINNSSEKTGKGLRAFAFLNERAVAHKPEVDGWENYNELVSDPEQNFVIASTHRSDAEVQIVINTFAGKRKLGAVTHRANVQNKDGKWGIGPRIIGKDNFLVLGVNRDPINTTEARAKDMYSLNPLEMSIMADRMKTEKMTPVVAAHRPTYHSPLPPGGGMADVILAHLSGSRTILPVAVDWPGGEPVGNSHEIGKVAKNLVTGNRPDVAVHIAKAIHLPEISEENITLAMSVLSSDTRHNKELTAEKKAIGLQTLRLLEAQSGLVMQALASKLPEDVQGIWGTKKGDQVQEVVPTITEIKPIAEEPQPTA